MSDNPYEDLIKNPQAAPPFEGPMPPGAAPTGNPYDALVTQPPSTAPQPQPRREPELRSAEYSPRQRLGNWMQDLLIAGGAKPYVAGRVGRGALDAASLIPPVGAAIAGAETGYHATRGDPLMAGVNAIGMVPGGTAVRRAVAGMPQRTLAPEEEQLTRAADRAYDAWRNAPVRYSPDMMDDVTNQIANVLTQRGSNPVSAPKQFAALEAGQNLKTQTGMTNAHFETLRNQLRGGRDRGEIAAGEAAADALERYMLNPPAQHIRSGTPQQIATARENLLTGRGNTAARYRSELISGKEEIADVAEERGRSFADTFRGRMGTLSTTKVGEKAMRGFNEAERDAVRDAVAGSLMERAASAGGKAFDRAGLSGSLAGGAVAGATPAAMTGGILGTGFGLDPLTAAATAATMYGGSKLAGRSLGEYSQNLAKRSADELSAGLRMRSPMAQAPGSPYGMVTDPAAMISDARKYLMYPWLAREGEEAVEGMRTPFEYR